MSGIDVATAYAKSVGHRADVLRSSAVGCFRCLATYHPQRIKEWIDDGQTAICAGCGAPGVMAEASGIPVGRKSFLRDVRDYWIQQSPGERGA